jgi:hypothetical protein
MAKWWFNLKVGKADTTHDTPSHIPGVKQGNEPSDEPQAGHNPDGTATAARSTGINPESRNPIDPSSPNLPPA